MIRLLSLCLLLLAVPAGAADVYIHPVPIGIGDRKMRQTDPIPLPNETARWIRVRTPRFDVISSADARRTEAIARELEAVASALTTVSGRSERPTVVPTPVFLFARERDARPYFHLLFGKWSRNSGAYVRHEGGGTMLVTAGQGLANTAIHELVHDLLAQREGMAPLWLEEGLAEYFAHARRAGGEIVAGGAIGTHVRRLRREGAGRIEDLLGLGRETFESGLPIFYARSWAAVDWLMSLDAEAFWPFLAAVEEGTAVEDALREYYGKSTAELRNGIRTAGGPRSHIRFVADAAATAVESRPLTHTDVLFELGAFLSHVPGAEREGHRYFEAILATNPAHGRTLAALGRYREAIDAAPADPAVYLAQARSLLAPALGAFAGVFDPQPGQEEAFRQARELAYEALSLTTGPEDDHLRALALGYIGVSHVLDRNPSAGIEPLELAQRMMSNRIDFALNLYTMYLVTSDRARAAALASAFERSRNHQAILAAKSILIRVHIERASALSEGGRLGEAAAIVRHLAAATADPVARQELEEQAEEFECLAVVNHHIERYNEAIALMSARKPREAIRLLDELLQIATDEAVIRDATRLREDLTRRR